MCLTGSFRPITSGPLRLFRGDLSSVPLGGGVGASHGTESSGPRILLSTLQCPDTASRVSMLGTENFWPRERY